MDLFSRPILTYSVPLLLAYPVVVSLLRFRRVNELQEKYKKYETREAMSEMTDDEAFEIQKQMIQLEFPFIYIKALQFALFRVCFSSPLSNKRLTNTPLDIRNPNNLPHPNRNKAILTTGKLAKTLHRHRSPDPRIRRPLSILPAGLQRPRPNPFPTQQIPQLRQDSRVRYALHTQSLCNTTHRLRAEVRMAQPDGAGEMRNRHVLEECGRRTGN